MILCALGMHHQPFARAVRVAAALRRPGEQFVVQHGHTPPLPDVSDVCWRRWLTPGLLADLMDEAHLVVSHGGVGTVMAAIRAGHTPVVVPRRAALGEHVDDHQLQIVAALRLRGAILPCADPRDAVALREARPARQPPRLPSTQLRDAIWAVATQDSAVSSIDRSQRRTLMRLVWSHGHSALHRRGAAAVRRPGGLRALL